MTKFKFLLQFFLILLIFVFPPLFVNFSGDLTIDFSRFNYFSALCLTLALFLYFQEESQKKDGQKVQSGNKKSPLWLIADFSGVFFLTFGSLVICVSIFELAAIALKLQSLGNVILPSNFIEFLFCAFTLFSSAFYEECLYRLYLPKALKAVMPQTRERLKRALFWTAEAAAVLLFAFAHRYQGFLAVLNALAAGIVLRISYAKSNNIWPVFLAHACYNAAALFMAGK